MRTSFHHQSEAQPPNGPLTAATSPDTLSLGQVRTDVSRFLTKSPQFAGNFAVQTRGVREKCQIS